MWHTTIGIYLGHRSVGWVGKTNLGWAKWGSVGYDGFTAYVSLHFPGRNSLACACFSHTDNKSKRENTAPFSPWNLNQKPVTSASFNGEIKSKTGEIYLKI